MTVAGIHQLRPRYGQMGINCKECGTVHLINKPCPHSIEAYRLEFEAEQREAKRQADRRYREEKAQQNQSPQELADVEIIEENIKENKATDTEPPIRDLIYKRMVEGLGLILASPRGRNLTNDFLREVFEEFLAKRQEVLG